MSVRIIRLLIYLFLPPLSGILLFLAFPDYNLPWLGWIGLAPLMLILCQVGLRLAFVVSGIAGMVYFAGFFNWILEVPGYKLVHHILLDLYLAPFFAVFGLAFCFIYKRLGVVSALFSAPFIWVILEYIRSNLSFLSLPMGLLAHSQSHCPKVIQIASVTGAYGVSFLLVMANAGLAAILWPFANRVLSPFSAESPSICGRTAVIGTAGLLVISTLVFGQLKISRPIEGKEVKVAIVQGNIEQKKKWDPKYAKAVMQIYTDLTLKAARQKPDLVVWPETATPQAINRDPGLYAQVYQIVKATGTNLLLGSSQHQKFQNHASKKAEYLNSAFLIEADGRLESQRYDKIRLFPFGEYLPMKETIPWSSIHVPEVSGYFPGKDLKVFQLPGFRFSVTICWENLFPDLVRGFTKRGAQFIINITNEAWFGKSQASHHFVASSVFRAVENRIYVVRCANTGVSCFIDPYGKIVDRVRDEAGQDTFVRGVLCERVIPVESGTIYTHRGDLIVWLSSIVVGAFTLVGFLRRKGASPGRTQNH